MNLFNLPRLQVIKIFKYSFIFFAIIVAVTLFIFTFINKQNKLTKGKTTDDTEKSEINYQIEKPYLTSVNSKNGPYNIEAESMLEANGRAKLTKPRMKLMIKQLNLLNLQSNFADIVNSDKYIILYDQVKANIDQQYFFSGNLAEFFFHDSIIKSNTDVKFYTKDYVIESEKGFIGNYKHQISNFFGRINANFVQKDKIINIKSDLFDLYWNKKIGEFIGNVILLNDKTTVTTNKMIAKINPKTNQLEIIYLIGNVKIIDGENEAISEYGEYEVKKEILTLKDNVILNKNGNLIKGSLLHYNFNSKKADIVNTINKDKGRVRAIILPKQPKKIVKP